MESVIKTFLRKGNIEVRSVNGKVEVIKWFPNEYYGRESEFVVNPVSGMYNKKDDGFVNIHPSCFKYKETCYVISFIGSRGGVREVAKRTNDLDDEEKRNYDECIKYYKEKRRSL